MATVSKNLFWQTVAAFLQIYTGGVIFILLAKMLPIEEFGMLSFGFSFATLLATCLDFGQSLMIMKDYPQKLFKPAAYVLNSMAQKLVLILFFGGAFLLYLLSFYEGAWLAIGRLFILFAILSAYILYLQALLRIKNRFKDSAFSIIMYAILVSIAVGLIYLERISVIQFIWGLILCRLSQLFVTLVLCKDIFVRNWYSSKIQKHLFKYSWSYGAHFIFGTFYFTVDTQIIALLLNAKDVALYQSIFRIVYIFLIVSDVASNVLLPYLSSKFALKRSIDELSSNILYLLLILGSVLFLFFSLFYKEIIAILYTAEYVSAYPLVLPLSIVILLRTSSSIYGTLLTISNNQVNRVKIVFLSMLTSILLNFLIIPLFGIEGSAWTSVLVHVILFSGYQWYTRKDFPEINLFTWPNIEIATLTLIAVFSGRLMSDQGMLISSLIFTFWIVIVVILMKKHQKISILTQILKDKGVM